MKNYTITDSHIIELASELAHEAALFVLCNEEIIVEEEDAYREDESGTLIYIEEMQDEFNDQYDYFLTMIENTLKIKI